LLRGVQGLGITTFYRNLKALVKEGELQAPFRA